MTTLIFIENVLGSGQVVKLTEDFGDHSACRDLRPGEHARLVVSPFKSVTVEEVPLSRAGPELPTGGPRGAPTPPTPATLERRCR
jgi:hypothetical protein